eukprot:COSAG04_NODE_298_length_17490_cov_10.214249_8_plen_193_part_00
MPLYLLVAVSLTVASVDPQEDFERKTMANNMLMAACAMLFVVQQELPRLDFRTMIDKAVLSAMVLIVVESAIVTVIAGTLCHDTKYILNIPPEIPEHFIGLSGTCNNYELTLVVDKIWVSCLTAIFVGAQGVIFVPVRRFVPVPSPLAQLFSSSSWRCRATGATTWLHVSSANCCRRAGAPRLPTHTTNASS